MSQERTFQHLFNHLPPDQASAIRISLMIKDALRNAGQTSAAREEAQRLQKGRNVNKIEATKSLETK